LIFYNYKVKGESNNINQ